MHASARLALAFALGLTGGLSAAENLPPLRVDPALLGGAAPARPARQAAAPLAGAKPAPAQEQPKTEKVEPSTMAVQDRKSPVTAAPMTEEKAAPPRQPVPPAKAEAPRPAARTEEPAVPQPVAPVQIAQPPQVEERPALPPLYSAHAEAGLVPSLKPTERISPLKEDKGAVYPTFIAASRIDGPNDNEVVAQGEAELRKTNTNLSADKLTYWKVEDELEAVGNVRYNKDAEFMSGPKLRLNLTESTGYFEQPEYSITRASKEQKQAYSPAMGVATLQTKKLPTFLPQAKEKRPEIKVIAGEVVAGEQRLTTASGKADRLEFQGESRMRLTNATYTTCTADDPDWYAKVADLNLDFDREVGEGRDASVVFKDVTLFYSPWLSFSLNNKRKSGFLAPTFGTSSKSGIEFTLPYYWDIAPNMDMTIAPRLMTKRGLQINSDFRYLNHNYRGVAHVELLPDDRLADRKRYGYSLLHTHNNLGNGFSGTLNINGVSDGTYFRDLSSRINQASQGNLLRQGVITYGGGWWSATANMQTYQTLQDPSLPPVVKPYERVPQFTLTANRPEFLGGTAFAFNGEYVVFDHPTLDTGRRTTLYPQLSLPLQTPAWHITPKLGLHSTRYDLDRRVSTGPDSVVRNLPIFSVDAGLAFELTH
jgi:LPS-assembly protein